VRLSALRLNLRARLLLAFGLVVLASALVSALAYRTTVSNTESDAWVRHTLSVIDAANSAQLTIEDMESNYREYLLSGRPQALSTYRADANSYPAQLDGLAHFTADNPPQVERWRAISAQVDHLRIEILEPGLALRQQAVGGQIGLETIVAYETAGNEQQAMAAIRNQFATAIGAERQLLEQRIQTADAADTLLLDVLAGGTLVTVLLGLVVAVMLAAPIGSAMDRLASVAQAIAQGDFARRIALRRGDEIGQAAAAFDAMAATLERDVAERLRVQAQTTSILDSAAEGIYAIDRQGYATLVNHAAATLTGYRLEELQGAHLHSLIHHSRLDGSPLPEEECPATRSLLEQTPQHVRGEIFWRKDGIPFPVAYTATPIREGGIATGVVVTFHDISERLAIEKMKDEFIAVVSHELRTPLTSIRGSLGLLAAGLMGPLSDRAQHMLDVALSNTERLIRLINDILDIERIESGRAPMEPRPLDARDLVLRCIEGLQAVADAAQVRLVEHAAPVRLLADPDRMLQTLTNLVSNAIKFSPPGQVVEIGAAGEDGAVHFSVRDRGRGIPADKLETIFGRFEQVDASDSREKGGTGLGLAISKSIVQQHGGRIWAESTPGQGSTFHVVLPQGSTADETPVASETPEASETSDADAASRPTILVVDDDADVIEVVGRMLAQQGYRPLGATSGEDAVALAWAERPAAILLDLAMPGLNGWQTLDRLKADPRTCAIPVLVLSGLERVRDERTEQTEGWLAKPVTPASLRDLLGHALARPAGPPRILIVEDDPDLVQVLGEVFAQHGVETRHATSGDEAIAISQHFEPDLLLLDLALPDGDGSQVVDWFRQRDRLQRVALVVYTARDLREDERGRLHLGPTEHLTKARIPPEEVRRRVLRLLERVVPAGQQHAA